MGTPWSACCVMYRRAVLADLRALRDSNARAGSNAAAEAYGAAAEVLEALDGGTRAIQALAEVRAEAQPAAPIDALIDAYRRVLPHDRFRLVVRASFESEPALGVKRRYKRILEIKVGESDTEIGYACEATTEEAAAVLLEELRKNGAAT